MDYVVVNRVKLVQFTADIRNKMKHGYVPVGGVSQCINSYNGDVEYCQAMIRTGAPKEGE